jgi:hypothetical protein
MRLLLVVCAAFVCLAADKPSPLRTIRVPVSAQAPLTLTDLKATVDNRGKARVLRLRTPQDDLLLITVLDLVGDIALVDPARRALVGQFRNPPAKLQVALMRAQDGLQVMLDPTSDVTALENSIMDMPVVGKAGLLETVETAAHLADSIGIKAAVRVAVMYLTDSDVRNYRRDFTNPVINSSDSRDLSRRFPEGLVREHISKIKDAMLRSQTPLFIVHLRYSNERLNEAYQSGLIELANVTGGSAVFCRSNAEIEPAIANMLADIAGQYHVTLQLPADTPRRVNVSLTSEVAPLAHRTQYVLSK